MISFKPDRIKILRVVDNIFASLFVTGMIFRIIESEIPRGAEVAHVEYDPAEGLVYIYIRSEEFDLWDPNEGQFPDLDPVTIEGIRIKRGDFSQAIGPIIYQN